MTEPATAVRSDATSRDLPSWLAPQWRTLTDLLRAGRLPHAMLVHGPAGVGKRALARAFAAALLCKATDTQERPCGVCRACRFTAAGTHPDLHEIGLEEDSRQLRIDQIRELARKAALTSSEGGAQVFVIDPADRLNVNAANALLKTLEEPRPGTLMLLVAEQAARLPATVLSRCQKLAIAAPAAADIDGWLAMTLPEQGEAARTAAIAAADGRPGVAYAFLDGGRLGAFDETREDLVRLLAGQADPVGVAARWADDGPSERLRWMTHFLRRAAWLGARGGESGQAPEAGLGTLTAQRDLASLIEFSQAADRTRGLLDTNLRTEQLIEALLLSWAAGERPKQGGRSW